MRLGRVLSTTSHHMVNRKTAGLLVIGDEILKGSTLDTNSHFLCEKLHSLGVNVKKVSVVADEVDTIAREIRIMSTSYDMVLTTGGVGPTHDDKTYLGLAKAFDKGLCLSQEISDAINKYLPTYVNQRNREGKGAETAEDLQRTIDLATQKLATIPTDAVLLWGKRSSSGEVSDFPVVKLNNVIAFPGVPKFCKKAFRELQDELFPVAERSAVLSETVFTDLDEFDFSKKLTLLAEKFPKVQIGSYPVVKNNFPVPTCRPSRNPISEEHLALPLLTSFYKTKLVIDSEDETTFKQVLKEVAEMFKGRIVYYDEVAWQDPKVKWAVFKQRQKVSDPDFYEKLLEAERVTDEILEKYSLNQIALSFNGGKDCTVLLHLLRARVDEKFGPGHQLEGFHIMVADQFPEATKFIVEAAEWYNIKVLEIPGPLKVGLEALKTQRPQVTAVFMGSRKSDPTGKYMKSSVAWTDDDWPRVLRVCPILNWSYSDVWKFLRGLCVPYCTLYDQGYTSLGGRDNTVKNPSLRVVDESGEYYLPAYRLQNGSDERSNRSSL